MMKRIPRLFCLLISLLLIVLCTTACSFNWFGLVKEAETEEEPRESVSGIGKRTQTGENGESEETEKPFEAALRILVASDPHMSANDPVAVERLRQMAQVTDAEADALIVTGDLTASGTEAEFAAFFAAAKAAAGDTPLLTCLGERDLIDANDPAAAAARFIAASGQTSADVHVVIGGCHFIGISPDTADGLGFSGEKLAWLEDQLSDIEDGDPHPVFVFQHRPMQNTVAGSESGVARLDKIFKNYPTLIDLSGHTLYDPADARAVMQDKCLAVSVGSLSYRLGEIGGSDYQYASVYPTDAMGGWYRLRNETLASDLNNAADVTLIEVSTDNNVRIRRRDLLSGEWVGETVLLTNLAKNKNTPYDYGRQYRGTPEFAENAALTADILTPRAVSVAIPDAVSVNGVQHYRCELAAGEETLRTVYRLANAGTTRVPFVGLTPGTTYTVTVTPVDTWSNEGAALTFDVTTPAVNTSLPTPDLLSLEFRADGTAYDKVSGTTLFPVGSPTVRQSTLYGGYEADFDGHAHYQYYGFDDCQQAARSALGFTFETLLKMDALPTASYVNPISSQESGGLGFEVNRSSQTIQFWCMCGESGNYTVVTTPVVVGEYMHLVATYNGLQLCLYVNGELADSKVVIGRLTLSSNVRARYLGVGADAQDALVDGGTAADCTIVCAAMWGEALTAEQVAALYEIKKAPETDAPPVEVAGFEDLNAVADADDGFEPVLRFAVTSDVHTRSRGGTGNPTEEELAASLLRTTGVFRHSYQYADMSDYKNVDAVIVVGDYTDHGTIGEYASFKSVVRTEMRDGTQLLVCLGNHEFYDTQESGDTVQTDGTYARFEQYFGHAPDTHTVIGGYHFIGVSPDRNGGRNYSAAKAAWLEEQLQIAAADDPTGQKPIFVYQHISPANSVYGSNKTTDPNASYAAINTGNVMKNYPQVVLFSGHSHRPTTDPSSIMQSDYTVLGTGTLAYGTYEIYTDEGQIISLAQNETGSLFYASMGDAKNEHGLRDGSVFMIVEVDAQGRVRIRYVDVDSHCLVGEPIIIDTIGRKDDFTLTADRAANGEAPRFADDAAVTVTATWSTEVSFSFPQATSRDKVRNYKVEVYQGDTLVKKFYMLSGAYYAGTPASLIAPCTGLAPATAYTVKVYAYNSWGQVSAVPLTGGFTTAAAGDGATPDVFKLVFRDDGTAYNAVSGEDLVRTGGATTATDDALGMTVGVFNGNGDYQWRQIADYYDVMAGSFTFEVYARVDRPVTSGIIDICSNQQAGGFGFEYKSDGKLYYFLQCRKTSTYIQPAVTMITGEYVHLVGTCDGMTVRLYLNGELAASLPFSGDVFFPLQPSAQYLSIGADSGVNYGSTSPMTGRVAVTNLYSYALTAEQVAARYAALPSAGTTTD